MRKFAWLAVLFLVGCANTSPMAVNKKTKDLDLNSKSVVLMTIDLARPEASRYVPVPLWVDITRLDGSAGTARQVFKVDGDAGSIRSKVHNKFMFRFALEPGKYELNTVFGTAKAFPFNGFFQVPLMMQVNVTPKSVTYVGRVNALLRPRVGNEFRAGSVIPLIDQAATGISGNTIDITVVDASQEDVAEFKSTFPALATTEIRTELLPAFDRPKVQAWWENDGKAAAKPEEKTSDAADTSNLKQAQK
jgi:hypothetical protein